jgi:hypothetical protein
MTSPYHESVQAVFSRFMQLIVFQFFLFQTA